MFSNRTFCQKCDFQSREVSKCCQLLTEISKIPWLITPWVGWGWLGWGEVDPTPPRPMPAHPTPMGGGWVGVGWTHSTPPRSPFVVLLETNQDFKMDERQISCAHFLRCLRPESEKVDPNTHVIARYHSEMASNMCQEEAG